jgi:hypothetical protein
MNSAKEGLPWWTAGIAVLLPVAVLVALFALFPRSGGDEPIIPSGGASSAPGRGPGTGTPPLPEGASPAQPGPPLSDPRETEPAPGTLPVHPLLGAYPGDRKEPAPGEPGGLSPEELERIREENIRKVAESDLEMRKRERQMFEDIMGPLEDEKAKAFLDLYYGYHEETNREYRTRIERGESPDYDSLCTQIRVRTYEKMEKVLDSVQMAKFRTWWEEKCFPKKD